MEASRVSAVLFAKDYSKVAAFYREVFGARTPHSDVDHVVLDFGGFDLVIYQIPQHIAMSVSVDSPPHRRERGSLRLNFPVQDIERSRLEANRLGGVVDERPPAWAGTDTSLYLGHDPEGNVFGAMPANKSPERKREG